MSADPATTRRPAHGRVRLLRVAALGGSSIALAVGAHLSGGGELPPVSLLGGVAVLLGLVAVALTARRVRLGSLVAVLAVEQLLLHYVLTAASGVRSACSSVLASHASHLVDHRTACTPPVAPSPEQMSMPGWPMVAGHVLATMLTAWLLARGEARLWALARRVVEAATAAPAARPSSAAEAAIAAWQPRGLRRHRDQQAAPRGPPAVRVLAITGKG